MIVSFADVDTHTSEIKFIKQTAGLDINRCESGLAFLIETELTLSCLIVNELAILHWEVVVSGTTFLERESKRLTSELQHDKIGVEEASVEISNVVKDPAHVRRVPLLDIIIGLLSPCSGTSGG